MLRTSDGWKLPQKYSSRKLSHQADKLLELSGLAAIFDALLSKLEESRSKDEYLAGIWRHDLVRGFC
jgi:hypothetical protein